MPKDVYIYVNFSIINTKTFQVKYIYIYVYFFTREAKYDIHALMQNPMFRPREKLISTAKTEVCFGTYHKECLSTSWYMKFTLHTEKGDQRYVHMFAFYKNLVCEMWEP